MRDFISKEDNLTGALREREKELNCLYRVEELLSNHQLSITELFSNLVKVVPSGWRFPELCRIKIIYKNSSYQTPGFFISPISEQCSIKADGKVVGNIEVVYIEEVPRTEDGFFLEKESKLIRTIADLIGQTITYREMKSVINEWSIGRSKDAEVNKGYDEWQVIIDFFYHNDHGILLYICRKMINYLLINGVKEAYDILNKSKGLEIPDKGYTNYPTSIDPLDNIINISKKTFEVAKRHLTNGEITMHIKKWIQEKNVYSLIKSVFCVAPSLHSIIDELNKRNEAKEENMSLYSPKERWLNVGLISHILSDKSEFIDVAKRHINYRDFFDIVNRIILPAKSQGNLGGKATGLFLAQKILEKESKEFPILNSIKVPKTWYITSDAITEFLQYNNLEELNEQKYKELYEIRIEYSNIVQLLKNSKLPPGIIRSLSVALDDFRDVPLIVRSSSILEDQVGTSFSGKYKSLFLSNQGTKKERLEALKDAVIEVYASLFGPDPIQYRKERNLLDIQEEMGILIQEVVGTKVGKYFFPLFSGVAFSSNEYRWSPRIKRDDGLVRIVPGLGTRAVDRLSDDFPILISPGQPKVRVNIVPEEIKRYSPKKMDVINLENNSFVTVDVVSLLKEYGDEINNIEKILSIFEYDNIKKPNSIYNIDFEEDDFIVTFEGVLSDTTFIKQISTVLNILKEKIDLPVDIEFAFDGQDLYLLQCRPQSSTMDSAPANIPKDISPKDIVFSAQRYISNGEINNISYVVYIDPEEYNNIIELETLNDVGQVVGMLNSILPKRQFVLIGPGRWGSRGDIKLGVKVTYADICNTAALIEVAKKKTGYVPELSFGTHFFQDLVEANIRYLPLYPDDEGTVYNTKILQKSKNFLGEIFPEYKHLENVIRVINVPDLFNGKVLKISMNAELGEAICYFSENILEKREELKPPQFGEVNKVNNDSAWRWRFHMAERLAAMLSPKDFGIEAVYLFGSTNDGTAGPGSDIDLLLHFKGNENQKQNLLNWFEGWSLCLAEINYLKTGYNMDRLLDIHIITDEDIKNKSCFAMKIESLTEPAYKLKLKS